MIDADGVFPRQPDVALASAVGAQGMGGHAEIARDHWLAAARSLGLDEAAEGLLTEEVEQALQAQMQDFMAAQDYEAALEPGWLLVYGDPWNRDHALDFALCLQHLGELESACRFYSTALLLDASDAYCLYRLGECLRTLGHHEDARALWLAAIESSFEDEAYAETRQQAEQRLCELENPEAL